MIDPAVGDIAGLVLRGTSTYHPEPALHTLAR